MKNVDKDNIINAGINITIRSKFSEFIKITLI